MENRINELKPRLLNGKINSNELQAGLMKLKIFSP